MTRGFDLQAFRQTGVQVVKGFFEPEMRERFALLAQRDQRCPRRQPTQELLGAVDWVKNPLSGAVSS